MRRKLKKAYGALRAGGLRRGVPAVLSGIQPYIAERRINHIMEKHLVGSVPAEGRIEVREGTAEDVRELFADTDDESLLHRADCYFENAYGCLVGVADGAVVGVFWWVDGSATGERRHPHLDRLRIELGPRDAYGFDLYLLASARGRGTSTEMLAKVECALKDKGIDRLVGYVARSDLPTRWLYQMSGYQPVRTVESIRLGGRILLVDGRSYIRNSARSRPHGWDYRPLWPRTI